MILEILSNTIERILRTLEPLTQSLNNVENQFLNMLTINVIFNQLLFFAMCDIALCEYEERKKTILIGLNTLLLYYILTYFVQRIVDIVQKVNSNTTSQRTFSSLFVCILKIVLEWAKAVIAIVCLKEQGLRPHPHVLYTLVTSVYYLSSEPLYANFFPTAFKTFHFEMFEGLEELFTPVLLELVGILLSLILLPFVTFHYMRFAAICFYHTVYLKSKNMYMKYWKQLTTELQIMATFPIATHKELEDWNDICAICLNNIVHGRRTYCGHIFHGDCLRRCIKNSDSCPLCKAKICIGK